MKSNNGAKSPQLPGSENTFEQVSTVIILDTFILALFSIVMLATALISITTHNGLLNSTSRTKLDREQDPKDTIAKVEKQFFTAGIHAEQASNFVSLAQPGSLGGSVHQNFLADSDVFTFQRPAPIRFFVRPPATQLSTLEKFTGDLRGSKAGSPEQVLREQATPVSVDRERNDSPTAGGSDPWNASGSFYDGYGISTIINNP